LGYLADVNIESPPSMHPCKKICDITGFEVCCDILFELQLYDLIDHYW